MSKYIILWKIDASDDIVFEAEINASGPCKAKEIFAELFPKDTIVGVKSWRDADGWF